MKTKIFLILAALMGGAGLAAIGTAMILQVFRTPATTPVAQQTFAQAEAQRAETEQTPAEPAKEESMASIAVPSYLQPQSAASALLRPATTTDVTERRVAEVITQPVTTEPAITQPMIAEQVAQPAQRAVAESAPATTTVPAADMSVGSSAVYVQDVTELPQPSYTPEPLPVSDTQSYQYFYQQIAPHGEWLFIGNYGYCWRPAGVASGWRPYWDGHWAWSECGWTWASSEPWGGSTYHYGRWMLTSEFGWVWVPGRQWAPAWVCWRQGPGFIGWAPLPPGAALGSGVQPEVLALAVGSWTMVRESDFLASRCATVALPAYYCAELLPRMTRVTSVTMVNNLIMNTGPAHRHIESVAGRPAPLLRLRGREGAYDDMRTRVENGMVIVARPPPPSSRMPMLDESRIRRVPPTTPFIAGPNVMPPPSGQRSDRYGPGAMPGAVSSGTQLPPPGEPPRRITRPSSQRPTKGGRDMTPQGPSTVSGPAGPPSQGPGKLGQTIQPPSGPVSPTASGSQTKPPPPSKKKPSKGTPPQTGSGSLGGPPKSGPPSGPPTTTSSKGTTQTKTGGPTSGGSSDGHVEQPPKKKPSTRTPLQPVSDQPPSGTSKVGPSGSVERRDVTPPPTKRTDSNVTTTKGRTPSATAPAKSGQTSSSQPAKKGKKKPSTDSNAPPTAPTP